MICNTEAKIRNISLEMDIATNSVTFSIAGMLHGIYMKNGKYVAFRLPNNTIWEMVLFFYSNG